MSKKEADQEFDLFVDFSLFLYEYPEISKGFYDHPMKFVLSLEETVRTIQKDIIEELSEGSTYRFLLKPKVFPINNFRFLSD